MGRLTKHSCDMKRTVVVFVAVGAMVLLAGCHRNSSDSAEFHPKFTSTLAAGSTGDVMNKNAQQYGVPLYPGAMPDTTKYTAVNTTGRTFLTYTTSDSMDKVSQFYASSLNVQPVTSGNVTALQGTTGTGATVTINVGRNLQSGKTIFTVLAVMRTTPVQTMQAPATVATTAPVTTPAPTATPPAKSAPDTTSPNWTGGGAGQTSGDNSDNSQNTIPYGQPDNSNGNNNPQGQDQGQTSGDSGNGNNQQSQDSGPPGAPANFHANLARVSCPHCSDRLLGDSKGNCCFNSRNESRGNKDDSGCEQIAARSNRSPSMPRRHPVRIRREPRVRRTHPLLCDLQHAGFRG